MYTVYLYSETNNKVSVETFLTETEAKSFCDILLKLSDKQLICMPDGSTPTLICYEYDTDYN